MVGYTIRKGNSKHGEIIKAEFDILLKHRSTGDYNVTNANPVNDIQTKYQA